MALKRRGVDFKGSLTEEIVPSDGTQPSARLRKEWALLCKVVITSTHALPWYLRRFSMAKPLKTLNTQWSTRVRSERCGCIRKLYEAKSKRETHWPHKYPWNLAPGYTGLQWSDSNWRQCVGHLQNAPKHRYSPSLDPTPNLFLGQSTSTHKASHLQKWKPK